MINMRRALRLRPRFASRRAREVARSTVLRMNRTEPSVIPTFTPPGCVLFATVMIRDGGYMHDREFGGPECQ